MNYPILRKVKAGTGAGTVAAVLAASAMLFRDGTYSDWLEIANAIVPLLIVVVAQSIVAWATKEPYIIELLNREG